MTGDAFLANQAELAALDHDDPHVVDGECECACERCRGMPNIVGALGTCICPDCACREDDQ